MQKELDVLRQRLDKEMDKCGKLEMQLAASTKRADDLDMQHHAARDETEKLRKEHEADLARIEELTRDRDALESDLRNKQLQLQVLLDQDENSVDDAVDTKTEITSRKLIRVCRVFCTSTWTNNRVSSVHG